MTAGGGVACRGRRCRLTAPTPPRRFAGMHGTTEAGQRRLERYDAGMPVTLHPYPARTVLDYVAEAARERPDRPALLFKGAVVSNGELAAASDAFAAALVSLGVRKGDRVALLLPNCPQFLIAELGAWKAGAVVAPLNPIYTDRELEEALAHSRPETLVTLTRFYARVKSVQSRTTIRRVIAANIKEHFPPVLRLLFTVLLERREGDRVRLRPGDHRFTDLLRAHGAHGAAGAARPAVAVGPDDPALLLMSGGTTGSAKAALGTHGGFVAAGLQIRAWLASIFPEWDASIMLPIPLFHVFGNAGVQAIALLGHNPISLIPNPRDLNDLVRTIRRVRPTIFAAVPALFSALLEHPDVRSGRADFSSIKGCFSGASPLLAETKARFERYTGGVLIEGYSLTEAMMAVVANPVQGEKKVGSVGLPAPDVEVDVVDGETGVGSLATGEVGEVVLRAPQIMRGYLDDDAGTREVLRDRGDGGPPWLFTGDLGYLDPDGYLCIVDRKKDLIKVSGLQVWPREVEEVIARHPAVADVGVAGVPHELKGEAVKAWVVLRPRTHATEEEIREHCRSSLAPYKVPRSVAFRSELPRNLVGKVLRRELRKEG